jgi:hypothetical protein
LGGFFIFGGNMKQFSNQSIVALALSLLFALQLFSGLGLAEGVAPPSTNLETWRVAWATDLVAFGGLVFSVVAFARANIKPLGDLKGLWVVVFSVAIGGGLGLAGALLLGTPVPPFSSLPVPFGGVLEGLAAGLGASIGYDGIKAVLGLFNSTAKPVGTTANDAARARLR